MKLQQLKYILEIVNHNLNVSTTAEHLFTSQPGISKQVRLLEEELGVKIFERGGKNFTRVTPAGKHILNYAHKIFSHVDNIQEVAREYSDPTRGVLNISTTHTQACYALPKILKLFMERYPHVTIQLNQGNPMQIREDLLQGRSTFAIVTESHEIFDDLHALPCYTWQRCVVVPKGHPLTQHQNPLTLQELVRYPLLTYTFGFTETSALNQAFREQGVKPNIRLTATDSEVIKTYVLQGIGIGLLANMAVQECDGLVKIDASHLFPLEKTTVTFRKDTFLRNYMYDFIQSFAPHLTKSVVEQAISLKQSEEREVFYQKMHLPTR